MDRWAVLTSQVLEEFMHIPMHRYDRESMGESPPLIAAGAVYTVWTPRKMLILFSYNTGTSGLQWWMCHLSKVRCVGLSGGLLSQASHTVAILMGWLGCTHYQMLRHTDEEPHSNVFFLRTKAINQYCTLCCRKIPNCIYACWAIGGMLPLSPMWCCWRIYLAYLSKDCYCCIHGMIRFVQRKRYRWPPWWFTLYELPPNVWWLPLLLSTL